MKLFFNINFNTVWGQRLYVAGSVPELGNWEPALAREMEYKEGGNWSLVLETSSTEAIEYRYFIDSNGDRIEEWGQNRSLLPDETANVCTLYDCWQERPANVAYYSSAFTDNIFAHACSSGDNSGASYRNRLAVKVSAPHVERFHSVGITGNQECLGNWAAEKAIVLDCRRFPQWSIELNADEIHFPLEYKFVIVDTDSRELVCWESGDNRIFNPPQRSFEGLSCLSGLFFRDNSADWRGAGTVIPLFSLRSRNSFGTGDFGDLRMLVDWAKLTGQRVIQLLPVNDTTASYSWTDSYPYSAISVYALHPIYICLQLVGKLDDSRLSLMFDDKQKELNALKSLNYEETLLWKIRYCRHFFRQESERILKEEGFKAFVASNSEWLMPYAAYSYLRDNYGTTNFAKWRDHAVYNRESVKKLCQPDSDAWPEISFYYFLQYFLHLQFRDVSAYARANGVVLKGDLPIGVNRNSIEVWTEPQFFNINEQTGAPPDNFSAVGQNWSFPTYNWENMEKDRFSWWKQRFAKLGDYFDAFRIDHILGFFRIWEIPLAYRQGLCGHFNPSLPLSKGEIESYGLSFNETRFTSPHIHAQRLEGLFGQEADKVRDAYLAQSSSNHYTLKQFCNTQVGIEELFAGKTDDLSVKIKNGLLHIANESLFLRDPYRSGMFHPRISASKSYIYSELNEADRQAFDRLYTDFFYRRHNNFWKDRAMERLSPLILSTRMLVCGEDLGMIPDSVPEVMNSLQILSLEIERMPKTPYREFGDLEHLPYLSVCTTSTHDMPPLRNWWAEEENDKIQRYYNNVLSFHGQAPRDCSPQIAERIIERHLKAPSMLVIIPLQDWFALDGELRYEDFESERINIPANPAHYWKYRMHIDMEDLLAANSINSKIKGMLRESNRK